MPRFSVPGAFCAFLCFYFASHAFQIDQNAKYAERVRKAIAARPRHAVIGGEVVAAAAAAVAAAGDRDDGACAPCDTLNTA